MAGEEFEFNEKINIFLEKMNWQGFELIPIEDLEGEIPNFTTLPDSYFTNEQRKGIIDIYKRNNHTDEEIQQGLNQCGQIYSASIILGLEAEKTKEYLKKILKEQAPADRDGWVNALKNVINNPNEITSLPSLILEPTNIRKRQLTGQPSREKQEKLYRR